MFAKLLHIKPMVWLLLAAAMSAVCVPVGLQQGKFLSPSVAMGIVQPAMSVLAALGVYAIVRGQHDRVRHQMEKSLLIGSVISVWFVVYFASGLIVTYVHNAVAAQWQTIVINLLSFGTTAAALEYVRHGLMQLAGRRQLQWFGAVVAFLFSIQQINTLQLNDLHTGVDVVKLLVATVLPALVSSLLATYLAVAVGLWPQLTYRLGIVAIMYLPPIIPKYDWYLAGISWLLLAIAIYAVIDRTRQEAVPAHHRPRRIKFASDVMFICTMVALVLFMTGAFSYTPQVIMSNSMHPVFSRGSIVIVQKASAMDVRVGDIVQYEAPGHMTTHRVKAVDFAADGSGKRIFTTQGDNSPSPDAPVRSSQIVGIIRAQIPYIGYPTVWLRETVK